MMATVKEHRMAPPIPEGYMKLKSDVIQQQVKNKDVNSNFTHNSDANNLEQKLKDALEKNVQWQTYNVERENYVTNLLKKYNQMSAELKTTREQLASITKNPDKLEVEQRRYFDKLLVQARQEIESRDHDIGRLNDEVACLKKKLSLETNEAIKVIEHWRRKYDRESNNNHVLTENNISQLQQQLKSCLEEFRSEKKSQSAYETEAAILREKVKLLEGKLDSKSWRRTERCATCKRSLTHQQPHVPRLNLTQPPTPPRPRSAESSRRRNRYSSGAELTSRAASPDRSSRPSSRSSGKPPRPSSKRPARDEAEARDGCVACPVCGREYPVSDHALLLAHIDECGD